MKRAMQTGTILNMNLERGFGFLSVDGEKDNAFFHCKQLAVSLPFDEQLKGRRVRFDLEPDPKGGRDRAMRLEPAD
jgi:cold shock CspA family protein